jgi:hypothetical protein
MINEPARRRYAGDGPCPTTIFRPTYMDRYDPEQMPLTRRIRGRHWERDVIGELMSDS